MSIGTDEEVFAAALSGGDMPEIDTTPAEVAETTQEATPEAPVTAATDAPQAATQQTTREDMVPSWRLREEAEQRRALEARLAELERERAEAAKAQPKEPVEIWDDPNAFLTTHVEKAVQPVQAALQQQREYFSKLLAETKHGPETVANAYKAIAEGINARNPEAVHAYQRIMQSMDPYGELVAWHKRQSILSEIGDDPAAYRNKILEEAMKDPSFQAKVLEATRSQASTTTAAPGRTASITALPSLNRATAAADDEDEPEDATVVFNNALTGGRRR